MSTLYTDPQTAVERDATGAEAHEDRWEVQRKRAYLSPECIIVEHAECCQSETFHDQHRSLVSLDTSSGFGEAWGMICGIGGYGCVKCYF